MLLRLSHTRYAAWCDRCLRGSEVITFDAPNVARFFAIERLRGAGWAHAAPRDLPRDARQDAERLWSAETYCPECAYAQREKSA
jgi:hypothetical protein